MKAVMIAAAGKKQTMIAQCVSNSPQRPNRYGAAGGDRTHDPWLRRPILYPLSYSRNAGNGLRRNSRPGGREIRAICTARAVHAAQRARFYQPAAAPPLAPQGPSYNVRLLSKRCPRAQYHYAIAPDS